MTRRIKISIQASHEQYHPSDLLEDVLYMEKKGIKRCWTSDHYMPWWNSGASGGAAWPWMGAALAKTCDLVLGTGVTAPILRYHPAIVAQVFATLASMFPNRVILGLGRGEAMNEVTSGNVWPTNTERFAMLREAIKLIKKLWKEKWVTFTGEYYWVKDSRLYTKPDEPIPIYIAAAGKQSAELAGEEGNGLITTESNIDKIRNNLIPAFEKGERKREQDQKATINKEIVLFIPASYDEDEEKSLQSIRFWRGSMIKAFFETDIHDPRKIEENGLIIEDDSLKKHLFLISSAEEAIRKISAFADAGITEIVLTNSSPNKQKLIDLLTDRIIPSL